MLVYMTHGVHNRYINETQPANNNYETVGNVTYAQLQSDF